MGRLKIQRDRDQKAFRVIDKKTGKTLEKVKTQRGAEWAAHAFMHGTQAADRIMGIRREG